MREILFRGKSVNDNEWYEGSLRIDTYEPADDAPFKHYQIENTTIGVFPNYFTAGYCKTVDPATVGQFTGLTDKNGKRIFEGDVIKCDNGVRPPAVAVVKFGENYPTMFYGMMGVLYPGTKRLPAISFYAETIDKHQHLILFQSPFVEVIGNIHDNPELIGERNAEDED